jgi:hypothetical protein
MVAGGAVYGAIGGAAGGSTDEKRCLEKLKKANAISPENAVKPEDAGISGVFPEWALERLIKRGEVKKAEDGRVYVDCKDKKRC